MKIKINHFKEKHQDRIKLVKLILENTNDFGLKKSKELMDNMLEGIPIEFDLEIDLVPFFKNELDKLNLDYEIL